jgi:HJR/Mrr/RecB family endonuclease
MMVDDDEYPRVIAGRVEPMPYHFRIGRLYEVDLFDKRQKGRDEFIKKFRDISGVSSVLLAFFVSLFLIEDFTKSFGIGVAVSVAHYLFFPEDFLNRILMISAADNDLSKRVRAYKAAKSEFDQFVLTTELDFWRSLRGVRLEQEAAAVFRGAGWQVSTTSVVGDGGVDLILRGGVNHIWCQCKGHAKPVSVAPVREIAGVCVASGAKPMLLVVNGLTKPAEAEACKLGVTVIDAAQMAALARGESIFEPSDQDE